MIFISPYELDVFLEKLEKQTSAEKSVFNPTVTNRYPSKMLRSKRGPYFTYYNLNNYYLLYKVEIG